MAKFLPFQGLRYSPGLRRELAQLITPPYDIISPSEQKRFYRAHTSNIIRLELGKGSDADTPESNRYTRARETLQAWLKSGVLAPESRPAYYLLRTEYRDLAGEPRQFTGLIGRARLEPFSEGKILPHERIFQNHKADRLNLLRETGVSFSPVFCLYRDPSRAITNLLKQWAQRKPAIDLRDWAGCRQTLWVITQPRELLAIEKKIQGKKLLIADGHHRYATALAYQQEPGMQGNPAAGYVMACLAEMHDPGLTVWPVYRLVRDLPALRWEGFHRRLEEYFIIEKLRQPNQLKAISTGGGFKETLIGYLPKGGEAACLLKPKPGLAGLFEAAGMPGHSRIYHRLAVVILNHLILERLLEIKPGSEKNHLAYTKDFAEAQKCTRTDAQAAFLPSLPSVDAIWDLAKNGETMPQKSTYFLPKLVTGLVMNPVHVDFPDH